jgi:AcrR family transcriptional regulator
MVATESELKQAILDLAYEKFSQHGFKRITMDEIAADLKMSKKTVYKYFESKEAILEEIVDQRLKLAREAFEAVLTADGPFDERIKKIAEMFPRFVDPDWQRLIADVVHTVPSVAKKIQALLSYFITKVAPSILRRGQKEGTVRKDLDVDLFVIAYMGATKELFNSNFLAKYPATEETIPKQLFKIFMEGVLTRR